MKNSSVVPAGLVGAVLGLSLVVACHPGRVMPANNRPECPHHWDFDSVRVQVRSGSFMPIVTQAEDPHRLSGPGANTNVPEFHDCQRVVHGAGSAARYGSLIAVFAWDRLQDTTPRDSVGMGGAPIAWPMVEVLAWDGGYEPLGIGPGLNCLFVSLDGPSPRAWMKHFGNVEGNCSGAQGADLFVPGPSVTPLTIARDGLEGMKWNDVPPVARWDWDTASFTQVIGFKCFLGWCEVGEAKHDIVTRSALAADPSLLTGATLGNPAMRRRLRVKGWYDQQRLAPAHAKWSAGAPVRPLPVIGTLIPATNLQAMKRNAFSAWQDVAYVLLSERADDYHKKFNFQPMTGDGRVSTIALCQDTWNGTTPVAGERRCPGIPTPWRTSKKCKLEDTDPASTSDALVYWWGRSTAPDGSERLWCIVRRPHHGPDDVPGTARWRWLADDETTWARCDRGCCTTQ
jgi:hypothetical protein